jgi:hypothetical protein
MSIAARERVWPDRTLSTPQSLVAFLDFVATTVVNKVAGLSEERARATPLPTSPAMSVLGLVKHLTAVQRQHVQLHIGGADLPLLWRADDHEYEFRLTPDDTVGSVGTAFDAECARTSATLAGLDLETPIVAYGEPNRAGRLLVDVLQESARHLGHLDILREMVDGSTGE